ncbi:hypothetical protein SAMN05421866_2253 [Chryseobacterium oranimense]|uniref:Lysozyme inhibitor LprI-like N-terminal domain-containing protein n=1 Tax=Chryseobacterium oranimense TaxID=421058 RepID=A0A1M5R5W4_9FLAO|nr:lysozyme inhibitor LprI family protein [Chryseobacterium oranimense]SHH21369.1 hypothetical protein SAMN05421866_2253 [Chryseobacterium oranimense]
MKSKINIKGIISACAIILFLGHLIFPTIKIDLITVILFCLIIIPWLEPLFKSVELPGGLKLEFHDLEKIEKEAEKVGLINKEKNSNILSENYEFIEIANTNQSLALISLRIEIEKKLREIAHKYNIGANNFSISKIITILSEKNILSIQESRVLKEILYTLNQASHGVEYDVRTGSWIIEIGPEILKSLSSKIIKRGYIFPSEDQQIEHWIDKSFEAKEWNTNIEFIENIKQHNELWENELENIYSSLIEKLHDPQKSILEKNQQQWLSYYESYSELLTSFDNLQHNVGREGQIILYVHIMQKKRERVLELEEILNQLTKKQ